LSAKRWPPALRPIFKPPGQTTSHHAKPASRLTARYNPLKYTHQAATAAIALFTHFEDFTMSAPAHHTTDDHAVEKDAVEAIVPLMPVVLPLLGGVMMLLIAFIAVFMA
jgi:hypothetical protein